LTRSTDRSLVVKYCDLFHQSLVPADVDLIASWFDITPEVKSAAGFQKLSNLFLQKFTVGSSPIDIIAHGRPAPLLSALLALAWIMVSLRISIIHLS